MATGEDKGPRVHRQMPASSQHDQHRASATSSFNPQITIMSTGPSVIFKPSISNSGKSMLFSKSVVNTRSSLESTRHNLSHTIGGTRPKPFPKTPETSNNSKALPDALLNSPSISTNTDRDTLEALYSEAVIEAKEELSEIKEGRVSVPTRFSCQEHEKEETECYPVRDKVHSRFMEKSVLLKNIAERFNVNINLQQKQYHVEIKGSRGNVQQALEELETIGKAICSEDAVFLNHSKDYMDSVERKCDVLLEKEVVFRTDKIAVTKQLFTENIIWSDSFGRELVVEMNHWDDVQTSAKVTPIKRGRYGGKLLRNRNNFTMGVTCWIDGKQSEESDLECLVTTLLTKVSKRGEKSVAIPLTPIANWSFDKYMSCFVKSSVRWLLESSDVLPTLVLLFTDSRDSFRRTDTYVEECVTNRLKELQNKPKAPEIRLIKGQLDKTEADVLVNTTAPNLDLSYGKVSSALLNAVGSKLQQECKDKYPKGITPDTIAVTGGYKLMCKKVFYITLPRYDGDMKNGIESIRNAMLLCLKTASDYGYETIAFPVIGTGTLLYPVDIVVFEMFGSVERHHNECPDTKLKEVRFVIFPKDTELFEEFKRQEEKLGRFSTKDPQTLEPSCDVKIKITGMRKDVLDAKAELESKAKDHSVSLNQDVKNLEIYENGSLAIRVYEANIIDVPAQGIVNAANQDLNHVGGVARVIARAAGETLLRECERAILYNRGPLNVSDVVPTSAGNLHFKYVLHAVGPRWSEYKPITEGSLKQCSDDLKHTITCCLTMAETKQLESIVMSTISSGAFGVPKEICAEQYARAILEFGGKNKSLREIHIVDNNHEMIDIVHKTFFTMITERKPTPFTLSIYVEQSAGQATLTDERTKNTDDRRNFKCTGRDRPKSTTDFIREELLYKSYGDKLVCSLASSNEVQVYAGDILHLDGITAVVCSETSKGDAKGNISKCLLEKGGPEYRRNKEMQFGSHRNIGEVITTKGGRNKYIWIMHALVSKEDLNVLAGLYRQIFEEAKTRELQAIALPLLGTAGENISPVDSSQALFNEWIQFCQKNMKFGLTLHLVINDVLIADKVKDVFKRGIDEMKQKITDTDRVYLPQEQNTKSNNEVVNEDLVVADEDCVICMDKVTDAKKLKCGHTFCTECIEGYFRVKMVCPTCGKVCGTITGDQPDGTMEISKSSRHITGFERHKSIVITYRFYDGQQGPDHPNPGAVYKGIARSAYLPDTTEGREICAMLKVAFERRLVFTIGSSRTTGQEGVITWNDIHHKTDMRPNTQFGYPDDTYLQRVREELEVKGITREDMDTKFIKQLGKDCFRQTIN
ncbi:uncharacterized protein LOC123546492 isoform X2 [Mercenaria mercenaria]|uniref:uncharacterized protein LOC123546492 isoform X2 n=1 Tax=Mercenaria mercenaria TaxID=6596 RepID=UPI00234EF90C|nr:uncharacterized protein LOC123546492 isoform X2 [Mercenaria mercenaria]